MVMLHHATNASLADAVLPLPDDDTGESLRMVGRLPSGSRGGRAVADLISRVLEDNFSGPTLSARHVVPYADQGIRAYVPGTFNAAPGCPNMAALSPMPGSAYWVMSSRLTDNQSGLWCNVTPIQAVFSAGEPEALRPFMTTLKHFAPWLGGEHTKAFEAQLSSLFEDEEELKAEGIIPSVISFFGLATFVASWAPDRQRKVALTFIDEGAIRWSAVDLATGNRESSHGTVFAPASLLHKYGEWMRL